jgi:hypothetical protein
MCNVGSGSIESKRTMNVEAGHRITPTISRKKEINFAKK